MTPRFAFSNSSQCFDQFRDFCFELLIIIQAVAYVKFKGLPEKALGLQSNIFVSFSSDVLHGGFVGAM